MIDAGIFDGDIVVIKKVNSANSGDIVVALIDENEVTLKDLEFLKIQLLLNLQIKIIKLEFLEKIRVRIQGKLAGLIRKF